MTYGEAYVAEKLSMRLVEGKWTKKLVIKNKPIRLPREKAIKYYKEKFFLYWEDRENGGLK